MKERLKRLKCARVQKACDKVRLVEFVLGKREFMVFVEELIEKAENMMPSEELFIIHAVLAEEKMLSVAFEGVQVERATGLLEIWTTEKPEHIIDLDLEYQQSRVVDFISEVSDI